MKTICALMLLFFACSCSGRYFPGRFFRYKPRLPFPEIALRDKACENDPNYADECDKKAAEEGYCKDQEEFMRKHCPVSCGYCSEGTAKPPAPIACENDPNYADECDKKAAIKDYCKDQEEFMRKHCPASCGYCSKGTVKPPAPIGCEDDPNYVDGCREKAATPGYCEAHKEFMTAHCPKSCKFCEGEPVIEP